VIEFLHILGGLLGSAMLAGGVLVIAGVGETFAQKAGVYNLGLEGLISLGAVTAVATVAATESLTVACLAAAAVGIVTGIMFAGVTVVMKANQVISGLALSFLGVGLAAWLGDNYAGQRSAVIFEKVPIPFLSGIDTIGPAFFNHPIPVYLAFFLLPPLAHYVMFYTRLGLSIRAVGENPAAADATGVGVTLIRSGAVVFSCAMAALAGAYLTLVFVPSWSETVVGGRGWIAIALVIFAGFRPLMVGVGAFLFGLVTAFGFLAQARGMDIPPTLLSSLPYLLTVGFMMLPLITSRRGRRNLADPPAALGAPYYRDER